MKKGLYRLQRLRLTVHSRGITRSRVMFITPPQPLPTWGGALNCGVTIIPGVDIPSYIHYTPMGLFAMYIMPKNTGNMLCVITLNS